MLNTLLTQIQTQLLSKRFLLATLLPLFIFLFGNGWMVWLHSQLFRDWISKIDNLKDASILATVLTTAILFVAYVFSALNSTLLECLEGKRGPFSWLRAPFYRYEKAKLRLLEEDYEAIAQTAVLLTSPSAEYSEVWGKQLGAAEEIGIGGKKCEAHWQDSVDGRKVRAVLSACRYGQVILFNELRQSVEALSDLLRTNSTALGTEPSESLKKMPGDLRQAILFARDSCQSRRVTLYNKRQFYYPGDMEPGRDASPQSVLYPTVMGNIGSTMRSYAISRYSLDLDIFWSRLQNCVQSDKDYFGILQDVKVQLDFLVTSIWLTSVFAILWTPIAFCKGTLAEFLAVGASGFLPLFLYSLGCDAYLLFADLMRGAVDLFRFKLLDSLHLSPLGGTEEERLFWTKFGNFIGYSSKDKFPYKYKV